MSRQSGPVLELLLHVDRDAREPLHRQVENGFREAIRSGRLAAGTPVSPSRGLARDLRVARSVVIDAYARLCAEGYLHARGGSRTTVAAAAVTAARAAPPPPGTLRQHVTTSTLACPTSLPSRQGPGRPRCSAP